MISVRRGTFGYEIYSYTVLLILIKRIKRTHFTLRGFPEWNLTPLKKTELRLRTKDGLNSLQGKIVLSYLYFTPILK